MNDLTVVYITANVISERFANNVRDHLKKVVDAPIISVSSKPIDFGEYNIVVDTPRSHIGIYQNALKGAQYARTKYIAIAEDDVLYSPEHFKYRPKDGHFAYNLSCWAVYTWVKPPIFSHRFLGRRNHGMLICERELYIEAMEERFAKYPDISKIDHAIWAEPGKYEDHLKVTVRNFETFYTHPANVMFSHPEGLSFSGLGTRKRIGELRAETIPYWGTAEYVYNVYS